MSLLSRDEFRNRVFARDNHTCVFCDKPAKDAHHIIERRLWTDGGYYLDNGASVCEEHHIACETTELSVEDVREACGILKPTIPEHFYDDVVYDKWGNVVQPNGRRLRGELFFDESVQKILAKGGKLDLFDKWSKYPRTYHLPWSEGLHDDDRMMKDVSSFEGKRVIVTEKMDGENTSLYRDYIHARSLDSRHHYSRDWVKQFWSTVAFDIPEGWRVCGENLWAEHSIRYDNLKSYFYGFSVWDELDLCLSWDETLEIFALLDITPVPVLYDGIYNEDKIKSLWNKTMYDNCEGYVVRIADSFNKRSFNSSVGKFVRKNHVQTIKHWMHGKSVNQNQLKVT